VSQVVIKDVALTSRLWPVMALLVIAGCGGASPRTATPINPIHPGSSATPITGALQPTGVDRLTWAEGKELFAVVPVCSATLCQPSWLIVSSDGGGRWREQ
jgi:hypothetical protein